MIRPPHTIESDFLKLAIQEWELDGEFFDPDREDRHYITHLVTWPIRDHIKFDRPDWSLAPGDYNVACRIKETGQWVFMPDTTTSWGCEIDMIEVIDDGDDRY